MPKSEGPKQAFVIGPIGDKDAVDGSKDRVIFEEAIRVFEDVIEPACSAFGIGVVRADQLARTGEIPEQIFRLLRDSEVVIADVTGANPNVMYELGLRHTTGRLTIQLGERGRLPFDISAIRTIIFRRTEAGMVEARKKLSQALSHGIEDGGDPVTATRVWFEKPLEGMVELPPAVDEEDEPGFLEKLAETEEVMQSLHLTLSNVVSVTKEITNLINESAERTQRINLSGGGSGAKLQIANRLASLLEEQAERIENIASEYSQSLSRIDPGMRYFLGRLIEEPEELAGAPDFPDQIRTMIASAKESIPSTLGFKTSLENAGQATKSLRRVTKRIGASLQSIAESSGRVVEWQSLLDDFPTYEP